MYRWFPSQEENFKGKLSSSYNNLLGNVVYNEKKKRRAKRKETRRESTRACDEVE